MHDGTIVGHAGLGDDLVVEVERQIGLVIGDTFDEGGQVAGLYLTPQSLNGRLADDVMNGDFREWSRVVMRGQTMRFGVDLFETTPAALKHWTRLSPTRKDEAWFISKEPLKRETSAKGLNKAGSD